MVIDVHELAGFLGGNESGNNKSTRRGKFAVIRYIKSTVSLDSIWRTYILRMSFEES